MNIDSTNADSVVARLDSWRQKAAAAKRDDDAELLDAVIVFIRANYPVEAVAAATVKGEALVGNPCTAATAECCPYAGPERVGCLHCEIDRERLFTVRQNPGRAYACALKWGQALHGRDKTFVAK